MRRLAALVACLLLSGCTGAAPDGPDGVESPTVDASLGAEPGSGVDVDTAALRRQKRAAGVEACPRGANAFTNDLPALLLPCLGGGPYVDLTTLRGPLVVNLWASWCRPCRDEMPHFAELHDKARGAVRVLGVDYSDPSPSGALDLAREAGATYPLVADPDEQLRIPLRVRGLPMVVFVRRDGTVAATQYRVFRSYAELRDAVRRTLGVTVPA